MKTKISLFAFTLIGTAAFSQVKDSIANKTLAYVAEKFPITRAFNIEFNQLAPYDFSSQLMDQDLPEGKVKNFYQAKASANINLIKKQRWVLSANVNYRYISAETETTDPVSNQALSTKEDYNYHSETLSVSYFSKLFKKMVIYSASASVDGSEKHFERFRGIATATMVLKANAKTKMTVGLYATLDPSVQTPVIPIFTYEHKFDNGLVADIILPKSIYLRKRLGQNGRLSLGSDLEATSFYLYTQDNTNNRYEFRQLEINSGLLYEHYLGHSFTAAIKTGAKSILAGRVFEKSQSYDDYFYEAKPKTTFYASIGISFDPFIKAKARR